MHIYTFFLAFMCLIVTSSAMDQLPKETNFGQLPLCRVIEAVDEIQNMSNAKPKWGIQNATTGILFHVDGRQFEVRSFFWESSDDQKPFFQYVKETNQESIIPRVTNFGYGPILTYLISPPPTGLACVMIRPEVSQEEAERCPIVKMHPPYQDQGCVSIDHIFQSVPELSEQKPSARISPLVGKDISVGTKKFHVLQAFFSDPLQKLGDLNLKTFLERENLQTMQSRTVLYGNKVQEVFYRPAFDHDDRVVFYLSLVALEDF